MTASSFSPWLAQEAPRPDGEREHRRRGHVRGGGLRDAVAAGGARTKVKEGGRPDGTLKALKQAFVTFKRLTSHLFVGSGAATPAGPSST